MKKLFLPLAVFTLALFPFNQAAAQAPIPDSKQKLIAELVALTSGGDQMSKMMDMLLKFQEETFPTQLESLMAKDSTLSEAQKKAAIEKSRTSFVRISQKMRKRIKEEINFDAYLKDSIYTIYDKHFTEAELKDLVAFYTSPTGKKTMEVMPLIVADSLRVSQEKLVPPLMKIVTEVMDEEMKSLISDVQSGTDK